jgi:hypothetical protein
MSFKVLVTVTAEVASSSVWRAVARHRVLRGPSRSVERQARLRITQIPRSTIRPHFFYEKIVRKNWTLAPNRASLVPLRGVPKALPGSRPAGSIARAGLRWWRRKTPLQPNKGSEPCLSRNHHQARPAGRTQSRLRCQRCQGGDQRHHRGHAAARRGGGVHSRRRRPSP